MRRRFFSNKTSEKIDLSKDYFKIEALEDGLTSKLSSNTCEYCIDNGSWVKLTANTNTVSINKGQILYFRGNLTPTLSDGIGIFTISKKCNVKGNIMSLLYGNNFDGQTDLIGKDYAFCKLFYNCINIVNASELVLPATTLASSCYESMFYGCSNLTMAPELPATTLADYCYYGMFSGCTSLATAPELPATTLANKCYCSMFSGCTSLTTAPELPATTLDWYCYSQMFSGCTSLATAPELPATTLAGSCYYSMFYGCTSLTTAPELPATTLASYCYYYMFSGCTSLTTAPELPATTLDWYCYSQMFYGCTSLATAPELPATTLASHCYSYMFSGTNALPDCSNIDFNSTSVLQSGGLRGLFAGTKVTDTDLNRILPKNSNGKYCLPATTLASYCYYQMFSGCTSLATAPSLPATTLASSCYESMFYGCSNLNNITMLATDISASNCLTNWVNGVASSGTFVKHTDMITLPSGNSGIPYGWTVEDYNESNLITFTVDDSEYQAEEGMTWADWVNSEYNTDDYYCESYYVRIAMGAKPTVFDNINRDYCSPTDVIIPNHTYILYAGGSND